MRPQKLVHLVAANLRRDLRGLLASTFGITAGIACLVFFLALGRGVQEWSTRSSPPAPAKWRWWSRKWLSARSSAR